MRGAFADGVGTAALSVAQWQRQDRRLSPGVAAAALDGPLVVPRGETLIVASSHSRKVDNRLCARRRFHGRQALKDRARWRLWQSGQMLAKIEDRETGASVRCLGSDPRRAHGLGAVACAGR